MTCPAEALDVVAGIDIAPGTEVLLNWLCQPELAPGGRLELAPFVWS